MKPGKRFEQDIKESIMKDDSIYFYRLRDSGSSFSKNNDNSNLRFTISNDYDCFMVYDYNFFALELKSTQSTGFSFERESHKKIKKPRKQIKYEQIVGLYNASKPNGAHAGFLFNFRDLKYGNNTTFFLDIHKFLLFVNSTDKKSINKKDIIAYGGIEIESAIKKVNYRYNMKRLLNSIKTHVREVKPHDSI